ncbi:Hypothetical predicted protein [Paramuricea clavata]|uniref:Uncharacterized protein n=1 Tax=Paramuricea clavata TaxID=317549 RepID=A0A7D9JAZ9_PARCT|nr:Hypothetical predicted protein [Paramuricea clavata]
MRTFGFAPHIFCAGFDRYPFTSPTASAYPYPAGAVAYYHQQEPCINPSIYPDLHSTMDIRGYMARYECTTNGSLGPLGTPIYHCSCNGVHRQHVIASHPTLSPQLSPLSYDSKRLPSAGTREESPGQEQRATSIVTLRTKAKEYELSNLKIKSEFEGR